jgi:hypothetical protein
LYGKPVKIVWFSPDRKDPCVYGCVAFYFGWSTLHEEYGKYAYFLKEVVGTGKAGKRTYRSQFLLSWKRLDEYGPKFDPAVDDCRPWKATADGHCIKQGCDCQVAIREQVGLDNLQYIGFVDQKQLGGNRSNVLVTKIAAERLFLARAVSENVPRSKITTFCRTDKLDANHRVVNDVWDSIREAIGKRHIFACGGRITSGHDVAPALARAFLDRFARRRDNEEDQQHFFMDDAKKLASLFRSKQSLLKTLRNVIADWAGIEQTSLKTTWDD